MENNKVKVKWYGYVALLFILVFFSGVFADFEGPLSALDFNTILGRFGSLGTLQDGAGDLLSLANDFRGAGGVGARDGFIFALTLVPGVMLAIGTVSMVEHFDGLAAASRLLNPILRKLMGIPGISGVAMIASLQSSDAGASMTKDLVDAGEMNNRERVIFGAFQLSAGAMLTNFFGSGVALFPYLQELSVPILLPLGTIIVFKFIGANLIRLYLKMVVKEGV